MGLRKFVSKVFKPVRKISQKIIPKEVRPALPFLAAAVPFMLPGKGIASLAFKNNPGFQRALLSSMANLGAQAAADPEGEDLNLLSAGLAAAQGLGTTQGFGDTLRGLTTAGRAGTTSPMGLDRLLSNRGFFTKAADLGLSGLAKGADLLGGTRETLQAVGRGPEAAGIDLFSKEGAKAAGKAVAIPAAQAVGDLGYTTATAALRDFEKAEAAELAAAGADEAAIANARRAAIREAMEVSGFEEEDILDTFDEIGLKDGGRVGYAMGGGADFGGIEAAVAENTVENNFEQIANGLSRFLGLPGLAISGGREVIEMFNDLNDKDKETVLEMGSRFLGIPGMAMNFAGKIAGLKEGGRVGYARGKIVKEGLAALRLFRRPKYRFEDEAKMTLDLTKTGRYTEKELLELDGDQIAEIYEYEGFTPPAPIEGSTKIIDTEEIMESMKNVTPEDMASGGIAGLKDGGMLNFGGKEMDLRGGGFVPIGKKEKADDVPARLSKNEFVMTADAVRAAGGGSVNKGAQRMYNLMNQLEARA
jgi:hypothetical protein